MIKEIDTAGYDSMDKSGVMLVEFYSKTKLLWCILMRALEK